MICKKCEKEVPDGPFCLLCGARQQELGQRKKSRGNGQGSVYQLKNKSYIAVKTLGWYLDENGKKRRRIASKCFKRKKDAVEALPTLGIDKSAFAKSEKKAKTTLQQLYNIWLPTHRAGKDTLGNYKAAFKYFAPLYHELVSEVDIDDLQECIDDCPRGKSTKKNMRTTIGLMYKYGIPRGYFPQQLNLADYLVITGEQGAGGVGLPSNYLETLRGAVGKVLYADYVVCQCYLGFRPSELLALQVEHYNAKERAFVGGAKTDAGKDRTVTISPKIQPTIDRLVYRKTSGQVFCKTNGERMRLRDYRAIFYDVLDQLKLENPIFEVQGQQKHTYTPHSCRHTFATLLKRVEGADKDKLSLIGHASDEQLRYYQDVEFEDLRKITDKI
ncbi:MAG: site-specific integrase [Elusimicrobiaceae bacterium]|nr:site-specific integrase [Elusimicrobiaceae bacterium]